MSNLPYYPRYPRDFFEGTAGMSFELKAAYGLVLDLIYMMGQRGLPDDPHFISGHLGMSVRKWNGLRQKLIDAGKIAVDDGIISNKRADKEKVIQSKFQDKQRENASKPRKNKDLAQPRLSHTDTDTEEKEDTSVSSKKSAPAKKKSQLPDGWQLPKDWGDWAMEQGMDELGVRREAAQFEDHHRSKGNTMLDWRRAWQTWVRNALKWQGSRRNQQQPEKPGYTNAGAFGRIPEVC